jgi:riboflavin transporter FmnP
MNKNILKITVLAALSAIGVVLMSYLQIPYPIAPFLKIEFSDFVVIFAFLLFGFKEALIVAVLKTGCDLLIRGPEVGGVFPFVAHITALLASLSYVFALWIASKIIKSNKIGFKVLKYSLVVLMVSAIMTLANYTILTPLFLGEVSFFGIGLSEGTMNALSGITGSNVFFFAIVLLYLPFNLLKGTCISVIAVAIGDTLLAIFKNRFRFDFKKEKTKTITNHSEEQKNR